MSRPSDDAPRRIHERRGEIDALDRQILSLINRRMSLVKEIGQIKRSLGQGIFDEKREAQLLASLRKANPGPLDDRHLERIFREILSASRALQRADGASSLTGGALPADSTASPLRSADVRVFALLGDPVSHSMGPRMMNAAFQHLGLPFIYTAFRVDPSGLAAAVEAVRALGLGGLSITIPHKTAIVSHLDELDPQAKRIGAVNTVVLRDGRLIGCNTDAPGAVAALQAVTDLDGRHVGILGAGGAARAVGFGVRAEGARISIINRSEANGQRLAEELAGDFVPLDRAARLACDILINTTPVGMHPQADASPVSPSIFHPSMVVMDAVYKPRITRFLQDAAACGCRIIEGIEMFVRQGTRQFELWTGMPAPIECMRQAIEGPTNG